MERIQIKDTTLIGSWEEVKDLSLEKITGNKSDTQILDGLVLKGYEMKWGAVNANGEKYDKSAFDKFIQDYFVDHGLNMPLTVQHLNDIDHLAGRVLYLETNSVGFYFVAYIPRSFKNYEAVKAMVKEGVLQGFSKEGWATDYDYDPKTDAFIIREMEVTAVSLVSTPANRTALEQSAEIKNALRAKLAVKDPDEEAGSKGVFDELFK